VRARYDLLDYYEAAKKANKVAGKTFKNPVFFWDEAIYELTNDVTVAFAQELALWWGAES
jgi:hypothetical protein